MALLFRPTILLLSDNANRFSLRNVVYMKCVLGSMPNALSLSLQWITCWHRYLDNHCSVSSQLAGWPPMIQRIRQCNTVTCHKTEYSPIRSSRSSGARLLARSLNTVSSYSHCHNWLQVTTTAEHVTTLSTMVTIVAVAEPATWPKWSINLLRRIWRQA